MFGPHLMLELYNCDVRALGSQKLIYDTLDKLPEMIGMHKISAPQIMPYQGKPDSFDKGGISAFVLIAESHITIHTFLEQRYATIDIFSCKDFDHEKATAHFKRVFRAGKVEKNLLNRGKEFSKNVAKASLVVQKERGGLKKL